MSLLKRPTVIERIATIEYKGALPTSVANYCRRLTVIWVFFFLVNGMIAIWTVVAGTKEIWAWYNGVISYVCIASLFFGERIVRKYFVGAERI